MPALSVVAHLIKSPPVIPSAISEPATQEVPDNDLAAGGHDPREDTHTNPEIDSPASDSDTSDPPHRSTRVRRRPARYNDFVLDSNYRNDSI